MASPRTASQQHQVPRRDAGGRGGVGRRARSSAVPEPTTPRLGGLVPARLPGPARTSGRSRSPGRLGLRSVAGAWIAQPWAVPTGLYLLAAALCLVQLGKHLPFAYNWESYTARDLFRFWDAPGGGIFTLTNGLMTDSGRSPLVAFPAWLGLTAGGVSLTALRFPLALCSALAVPMLWFTGRRMAGPGPAALAAVLLALSPAFLLYARTATVVGPSGGLALATVLVLLRVVEQPRAWRWLLLLQLLFVVDSYAYAPIRFLWPLGMVLLGWELLLRRGERQSRLCALLVTVVVLPVTIVLLDGRPGWQPWTAVEAYYHGRGEQVLALSSHPTDYLTYLTLSPEEQARVASGSSLEIARRLVAKNIMDSLNLLLDRKTLPVVTDYWNPHGRLLPAALLPCFLLGLLVVGRGARKGVEDRALLLLVSGMWLPLLLTTQVHVGRLFFVLPWLFLVIARGWFTLFRAGARLLSGWFNAAGGWRFAQRFGGGSALLWTATLVMIVLVSRSTWTDYRLAPRLARAEQATALLREVGGEAARRHVDVVVVMDDPVGAEIEAINVAPYRLVLDARYRFVDLTVDARPAELAPDGRVTLLYGGVLTRLEETAATPRDCEAIYLFPSAAEKQFTIASAGATVRCGHPLDGRILPW